MSQASLDKSLIQKTFRNAAAPAVGSAVSLMAALSAHAAIVPIAAGDFDASATVVTFDEVAVGTTIPFSVGIADFDGLGGLVSDDDLGSAMPPSPSGRPYLYSGSVGVDDTIEVAFGAGQTAVGAYFDLAGSGSTVGVMQVEFYNGATLLGTLNAVPSVGTGGFVGGATDSDLITRVVFRDIDTTLPISFRLDDVTFVPAPGAAAALLVMGLCTARRRRVFRPSA